MAFAGGIGAAVLIAALAVCASSRAHAQITTLDGDGETRALLFSGRDLWRNGIFAHGGLLLAPGGVDQDGFNLKLVLSGGVYRYTGGTNAGDPPGLLAGWQIVGMENALLVMPGFRVKRGALEVKVFFGLDLEYHKLWPDDPSNSLRGQSLGLRFAGEFWYEPTATTMVAGDASLSSVGGNSSARLAYGWHMFDEFYFGPETQVYGGDGYRQWRLGAHFTALKTETNEWVAAGGWARDSSGQSTPYARLGMVVRK